MLSGETQELGMYCCLNNLKALYNYVFYETGTERQNELRESEAPG
jgi:hypothetical protein